MNDLTPKKIYNVLFLCTGNSARSVIAECVLNRWVEADFGRSARAAFRRARSIRMRWIFCDAKTTRRKSCVRRAGTNSGPRAPHLDFVFTVCDNAANGFARSGRASR